MRRSGIALIALVALLGLGLATGQRTSSTDGPVRLTTALSSVAAASGCHAAVFTARPSARVWYRVPALVRTSACTLLAFAERRDTDSSDLGDFETVVARSSDDGCTWSAPRLVGDSGADRVSNPVPVIDPATHDVLVLSVVTPRGSGTLAKGLYLQRSTDDGRTFQALRAARRIVPDGFKGGLTGPGHGLALTGYDHAGRLIVPMGYKRSNGDYGGYGVYSDDHGASWSVGYDHLDTTGRHPHIEGTLAELADGRLFVSYRDRIEGAKAGTTRRSAYSSDGGESLDGALTLSALPVVAVQGSALALTGAHAGLLLFSSPSDKTATLRRDMAIYASRDAGVTWGAPYPVELESKPGSYSDLAQLDDEHVGVLYETGVKKWKEKIMFRTVAVGQILTPTQVSSSLKAVGGKGNVMVTVTVPGISSPPGKVTVAYDGPASGSVSIALTYSNQGRRRIVLPSSLPAGTYRLTVTYDGGRRVADATDHTTARAT